MAEYIFGEKSGIYIIDLTKTEAALAKAKEVLRSLAASGKTVLFVGTKKQAKEIIKQEAQRSDMFYVNERWLGGCLTNFTTIRKSVERLNHLQALKTGEEFESMTKKERASIEREIYKLLKNLEGIKEMKKLPDALIIVDAEVENTAIKEAKKIDVPVIALVDTNCDPGLVDYPIPGNDDAIRSIKYIISSLADAVEKGHKEYTGKGGVDKTEEGISEEKIEEEKSEQRAEPEPEIEEKEKGFKAGEETEEAETEEITSEEDIEGDIKLNGDE